MHIATYNPMHTLHFSMQTRQGYVLLRLAHTAMKYRTSRSRPRKTHRMDWSYTVTQ